MKDNSHYTLSISDLLMGFLFVFIIILMKFMIEYRNKKSGLLKPLEKRNELLESLKKEIKDKGIDVETDKENGVLKLKSLHYFKRSRYELNETGEKDFREIKKIFKILVCYSDLNNPEAKNRWKNENTLKKWKKYCSKEEHRDKNGLIDSILIEGHADFVPIGKDLWYAGIKTNLDLAMKRAQTVFEFLLEYKEATPESSEYGNHFYASVNKQGKPLFGVTSYGNLRRNAKNQKGNNVNPEKTDRRIDIRFIMSQSEDIQKELKNNSKRGIEK